MNPPPIEITKLPYADRQLVVVVTDQVAAADRKATSQARGSSKSTDWAKVATLTIGCLTGQVVSALPILAVQAVEAWNRMRESGLNVLTVARSEAAQLNFPPGHPRDGTLYVGHPALPQLYYTPASFHRLCFEHKVCEAIRLLMSLGATQISIEHISGWAQEFSANLAIPLASANVGAGAGAKGKSGSAMLYQAQLTGSNKPKIPKGMVWYEHEPTWRELVVGRTKHGLKNFSLNVRYEDDFGINAGFKLAVNKAGFELGGNFEQHQSTIWRMEGSF